MPGRKRWWFNVSTLSRNADGGYNQAQMQDLINKEDELIHALIHVLRR
ncbi:MAG: hypothetical protein IPK32_02465 [Verrucomicrobiaceae bacterium]|nr:hypothetical protein [Verrucomicrobiaceae bacterium]